MWGGRQEETGLSCTLEWQRSRTNIPFVRLDFFLLYASQPHIHLNFQRIEHASEKTVRNWAMKRRLLYAVPLLAGCHRATWQLLPSLSTPGPSSTQPVRSYTWTHLPTNLLLLPRYHCLQEWHYYYGYLASHQEQNTVFIFKNHYRLLRVREGSSWTNFP